MSLKAEIDQFYLTDEREKQEEQVVQVPNSEDELDKVSGLHPSGLVIACIDDNSKDEEEEISLNPRKGLKDLLTRRKKGSKPKDVPGTQPLPNLPPPPPPPTINLLPIPNLKKKTKGKETEEREIVPLKDPK